MNQPPPEPIWRGDHHAWHRSILSYGVPPLPKEPISSRARAVAVTVFHAASYWNSLFCAPLECQIQNWAVLFDSSHRGQMEWLTVDLAERAVHAYFRESITGRLLPACVIQGAAILRLEAEAQHGA